MGKGISEKMIARINSYHISLYNASIQIEIEIVRPAQATTHLSHSCSFKRSPFRGSWPCVRHHFLSFRGVIMCGFF